jgi:hypothetical protein
MAVELAGILLDKLTRVDVREQARLVRHAVPGLSGELTQNLGRPSVAVSFRGIFYGAEAGAKLKELRDKYLAREPVDFLCEAVGQGYFTQVVIDEIHVAQRAGLVDQFDYACEVVEYVPPPPPPAVLNPLADIDTSLLEEAAGMMDDIQNAIAQVADLAQLLAGAVAFGDPTTRLPNMLTSFTDAAGTATTTLQSVADLL